MDETISRSLYDNENKLFAHLKNEKDDEEN